MTNKLALTAFAALLLATPVLAQTNDAEALAQAPVYQSVPANRAVADVAPIGSDAELLAAVKSTIATDAAQAPAAKVQTQPDTSWNDHS